MPNHNEWPAAIERYIARRAAEGNSPTSTALRVKAVRAFAASIDVAPYGVTPSDVEAWFDARGLARSSRISYRKALGSFYRLAVRDGSIDASPVLPLLGKVPREISSKWSDVLAEWARDQLEAGISPSTITTRRKIVAAFASDIDRDPWHVSADHVFNWLDEQDVTLAAQTRASRRAALRAFYQWGYRKQRIADDPTEETSRRASVLLAGPEWETEIAAYRRYLRTEGKPESTTRLRTTHLRRFGREVGSLAPFDVDFETLVDYLAAKRWAPETRRSYRSSLRSFYRFCKRSGRIKKDPSSKLPPVKSPQASARPAADDDYRLALAKADRREHMALRLAAELGMRCAEVATVHTSDMSERVELNAAGDPERLWSITVHGKGRKKRVLPLTDSLAGMLRSCPSGYVFPGQIDGHLSPQHMGKLISQLLPPGVTMHMLRHRFATKVYNIDRDVFTLQQMLGHASPSTTQRYVLVNERSMRRLAEAVGS